MSVPVAALAIWLLTMSGSYRRIEKVLLAIACVFVTYIVAGVMVGPDWGDALLHTVVPHVEATPQYLSLLVAERGYRHRALDAVFGAVQRGRERTRTRRTSPTSASTP